MGTTRFKKFDRHRFRKAYGILRVVPSYTFRSTKETLIETVDVSFANEDEKSIVLTEKYSGLPTVIATPKVSSSVPADQAVGNLNVFIKSVAIENKNVTVTIATSAKYTGTVSVQSIFIAGG